MSDSHLWRPPLAAAAAGRVAAVNLAAAAAAKFQLKEESLYFLRNTQAWHPLFLDYVFRAIFVVFLRQIN
jgi:hypothetical protein